MRRCALLFCALLLLVSGCSLLPDSTPKSTPTPLRPIVREAIHVANPDGTLTVTLAELTMLRLGDLTPDTQVLAVLADGSGSPSYVLYPSNQPGLAESSLDLSDYPLQLSPTRDQASVWVLALRHNAYSVSEKLGQTALAGQLATAFDHMLSQPDPPERPLSVAVAEAPALLEWFGEIEVLGEFSLTLHEGQGWSVGENQTQSIDGGFRMHYSVAFAPIIATPQVTPSTPEPTRAVEFFDQPIPGYRRVVNEDFEGGQSSLRWFTGSDPTYVASLVDGAYQILLTGVDATRSIALSWGSLQELTFDNYVVRARMHIVEPNIVARYGLWLHYQDEYNFLFFGLETTGRYRIARFQRIYTEFASWTSHVAVAAGNRANDVEVRIEGDSYTMAVNGQPLVTISDDVLHEGRIAFFCFAETVPATCQLQRIEVWIPEDAPFPMPTDTPTPE